MRGARMWCRSLAICALVLGLAAIATPGYAQTGQVKGKVVDADGKPVEGAVVTIEGTDSAGRKFTLKTNKSGEFIQIGLTVGNYKITAEKDGMSQSFNQRIRLEMSEVNFVLKPGAVAEMSEEDRKKEVAKIEALVPGIEEHAGALPNVYRDRLEKRIGELTRGKPLDETRLAQEAAYLAERSDITEEVARLKSHLAQFRQTLLGEAGEAGKRLDFLLQEMNREANTVLSKSGDVGVSESAITIKAEVEKLREQVQNVE